MTLHVSSLVIWRVYGNCPEGVWQVSFGCLEGVLMVSGRCLNPISPGVLGPGNTPGGHKVPTLNLNALNCCLTLKLYVCFQNYILTSQEKKNWPKSQKVSDILRFEIFLDLRFCHDLTHENGRNSLNF